MISLIAAMAQNRVIGFNNQMPWHMPADLAHFKKVTSGKPVIMGRKTFDSIGRLLPGRRNIVISRQTAPAGFAGDWVASLEQALALVQDAPEVMIIGGGQLYEQALPMADRLYLTHIDFLVEGDAFFPDYTHLAWQVVDQQPHAADAANPHPYTFVTYQRITS